MSFVLMAFVICFWFFFPIPIGNQMRVTLVFWWNAQWDQSQVVGDASRVWGSLRYPAGLVRRVLEFTACCGLHPGSFAECFGMPEVKITAILGVWHTFQLIALKTWLVASSPFLVCFFEWRWQKCAVWTITHYVNFYELN